MIAKAIETSKKKYCREYGLEYDNDVFRKETAAVLWRENALSTT